MVSRVVLAAVLVSSVLAACQEEPKLDVHATHNPVVETSPINPNLRNPIVINKAKIFFVKEDGGSLQYVGVDRDIPGKEPLKEALAALFTGPTEDEVKAGLATEIPKDTNLIDVKDAGPEEVEINLSKPFSSDGGSDSIEARLEQLRKTISGIVQDKKVFLEVEGSQLTEAGGEGIEVHQPIIGEKEQANAGSGESDTTGAESSAGAAKSDTSSAESNSGAKPKSSKVETNIDGTPSNYTKGQSDTSPRLNIDGTPSNYTKTQSDTTNPRLNIDGTPSN